MAMPLVRCRRHALCKKAKGAPLLHRAQLHWTSKSKSKSSCSLSCFCSFVGFPPLVPPRTRVCIYIDCSCSCSCCGYGKSGFGGYSGIMYFDDIGRSGKAKSRLAVGCLPAPLRSGPAENRRDCPPAPLTHAGRCRYRFCARAPHGVVLRCRSAGHSPKAVVTGLKATIGERHEKARMPRGVLTGAPPKSRGAPYRRPFQFGQTSNKEAPDTPLRYVTGFDII